MVPFEYVTKNAQRFKKTNTATLYKRDGNVFKIIEPNVLGYNYIMNNITYCKDLHDNVSPNLILPTDLVADKKQLRGYQCDFVAGKDLKDLAKGLSIEEKIQILNQLTSLLQEINQYLVVGDINLGNCMYDKKHNGYLIDFDLATKPDYPPFLLSLYFFKDNEKKIIESSINTDILKIGIIIASVLYNQNFEECFMDNTPSNNWNKFLIYTENSLLKDYFKSSFQRLINGQNIEGYLTLPTSNSFIKSIEQDAKSLRRLMK